MSKLFKLILLFCVRLKLSEQSVFTAENTPNTTEFSFEPYRQCFSAGDIIDCLHTETVSSLDKAIGDNDTWHLGEYVTLERNPEFVLAERSLGRGADDGVMGKFVDVLKSRRLQLQSDLMPMEEGRKKKNKHGGMFMFSGLALAALIAQLVLGKVAFVAAAALILAKIALFVSTTSSLKKHAAAESSGGATEHVVYTDHGHGGGGGPHDGYQRRFNRPYAFPYEENNELRDRDIGMDGI